MTTYANDYVGTRVQLFEEELAKERVVAAEVARKIQINMSKRMIQINPSAIFLFSPTAAKERVARLLFRGSPELV